MQAVIIWSVTHQADWDVMTSELSFSQEIAKREVSVNGVMNTRKPEIKNNVFDAKFMLPLSNHFFVFGGQVQQAKLQDDSVTRVVTKTLSSGHKASRAVFESSKNSVKQSALFLEDRIDIGKDILLTLGSRLDHHEKYGSHWEPKSLCCLPYQ